MAVLKIFSDGRFTYAELDGKSFGGGIKRLEFKHDCSDKSLGERQDSTLSLDIDVKGFRFDEDGYIDAVLSRMRESEKQRPTRMRKLCDCHERDCMAGENVSGNESEGGISVREKEEKTERCLRIAEILRQGAARERKDTGLRNAMVAAANELEVMACAADETAACGLADPMEDDGR